MTIAELLLYLSSLEHQALNPTSNFLGSNINTPINISTIPPSSLDMVPVPFLGVSSDVNTIDLDNFTSTVYNMFNERSYPANMACETAGAMHVLVFGELDSLATSTTPTVKAIELCSSKADPPANTSPWRCDSPTNPLVCLYTSTLVDDGRGTVAQTASLHGGEDGIEASCYAREHHELYPFNSDWSTIGEHDTLCQIIGAHQQFSPWTYEYGRTADRTQFIQFITGPAIFCAAKACVPRAFAPKITGMLSESLTILELYDMLMQPDVRKAATLCAEWLNEAMAILDGQANVIQRHWREHDLHVRERCSSVIQNIFRKHRWRQCQSIARARLQRKADMRPHLVRLLRRKLASMADLRRGYHRNSMYARYAKWGFSRHTNGFYRNTAWREWRRRFVDNRTARQPRRRPCIFIPNRKPYPMPTRKVINRCSEVLNKEPEQISPRTATDVAHQKGKRARSNSDGDGPNCRCEAELCTNLADELSEWGLCAECFPVDCPHQCICICTLVTDCKWARYQHSQRTMLCEHHVPFKLKYSPQSAAASYPSPRGQPSMADLPSPYDPTDAAPGDFESGTVDDDDGEVGPPSPPPSPPSTPTPPLADELCSELDQFTQLPMLLQIGRFSTCWADQVADDDVGQASPCEAPAPSCPASPPPPPSRDNTDRLSGISKRQTSARNSTNRSAHPRPEEETMSVTSHSSNRSVLSADKLKSHLKSIHAMVMEAYDVSQKEAAADALPSASRTPHNSWTQPSSEELRNVLLVVFGTSRKGMMALEPTMPPAGLRDMRDNINKAAQRMMRLRSQLLESDAPADLQSLSRITRAKRMMVRCLRGNMNRTDLDQLLGWFFAESDHADITAAIAHTIREMRAQLASQTQGPEANLSQHRPGPSSPHPPIPAEAPTPAPSAWGSTSGVLPSTPLGDRRDDPLRNLVGETVRRQLLTHCAPFLPNRQTTLPCNEVVQLGIHGNDFIGTLPTEPCIQFLYECPAPRTVLVESAGNNFEHLATSLSTDIAVINSALLNYLERLRGDTSKLVRNDAGAAFILADENQSYLVPENGDVLISGYSIHYNDGPPDTKQWWILRLEFQTLGGLPGRHAARECLYRAYPHHQPSSLRGPTLELSRAGRQLRIEPRATSYAEPRGSEFLHSLMQPHQLPLRLLNLTLPPYHCDARFQFAWYRTRHVDNIRPAMINFQATCYGGMTRAMMVVSTANHIQQETPAPYQCKWLTEAEKAPHAPSLMRTKGGKARELASQRGWAPLPAPPPEWCQRASTLRELYQDLPAPTELREVLIVTRLVPEDPGEMEVETPLADSPLQEGGVPASPSYSESADDCDRDTSREIRRMDVEDGCSSQTPSVPSLSPDRSPSAAAEMLSESEEGQPQPPEEPVIMRPVEVYKTVKTIPTKNMVGLCYLNALMTTMLEKGPLNYQPSHLAQWWVQQVLNSRLIPGHNGTFKDMTPLTKLGIHHRILMGVTAGLCSTLADSATKGIQPHSGISPDSQRLMCYLLGVNDAWIVTDGKQPGGGTILLQQILSEQTDRIILLQFSETLTRPDRPTEKSRTPVGQQAAGDYAVDAYGTANVWEDQKRLAHVEPVILPGATTPRLLSLAELEEFSSCLGFPIRTRFVKPDEHCEKLPKHLLLRCTVRGDPGKASFINAPPTQTPCENGGLPGGLSPAGLADKCALHLLPQITPSLEANAVRDRPSVHYAVHTNADGNHKHEQSAMIAQLNSERGYPQLCYKLAQVSVQPVQTNERHQADHPRSDGNRRKQVSPSKIHDTNNPENPGEIKDSLVIEVLNGSEANLNNSIAPCNDIYTIMNDSVKTRSYSQDSPKVIDCGNSRSYEHSKFELYTTVHIDTGASHLCYAASLAWTAGLCKSKIYSTSPEGKGDSELVGISPKAPQITVTCADIQIIWGSVLRDGLHHEHFCLQGIKGGYPADETDQAVMCARVSLNDAFIKHDTSMILYVRRHSSTKFAVFEYTYTDDDDQNGTVGVGHVKPIILQGEEAPRPMEATELAALADTLHYGFVEVQPYDIPPLGAPQQPPLLEGDEESGSEQSERLADQITPEIRTMPFPQTTTTETRVTFDEGTVEPNCTALPSHAITLDTMLRDWNGDRTHDQQPCLSTTGMGCTAPTSTSDSQSSEGAPPNSDDARIAAGNRQLFDMTPTAPAYTPLRASTTVDTAERSIMAAERPGASPTHLLESCFPHRLELPSTISPNTTQHLGRSCPSDVRTARLGDSTPHPMGKGKGSGRYSGRGPTTRGRIYDSQFPARDADEIQAERYQTRARHGECIQAASDWTRANYPSLMGDALPSRAMERDHQEYTLVGVRTGSSTVASTLPNTQHPINRTDSCAVDVTQAPSLITTGNARTPRSRLTHETPVVVAVMIIPTVRMDGDVSPGLNDVIDLISNTWDSLTTYPDTELAFKSVASAMIQLGGLYELENPNSDLVLRLRHRLPENTHITPIHPVPYPPGWLDLLDGVRPTKLIVMRAHAGGGMNVPHPFADPNELVDYVLGFESPTSELMTPLWKVSQKLSQMATTTGAVNAAVRATLHALSAPPTMLIPPDSLSTPQITEPRHPKSDRKANVRLDHSLVSQLLKYESPLTRWKPSDSIQKWMMSIIASMENNVLNSAVYQLLDEPQQALNALSVVVIRTCIERQQQMQTVFNEERNKLRLAKVEEQCVSNLQRAFASMDEDDKKGRHTHFIDAFRLLSMAIRTVPFARSIEVLLDVEVNYAMIYNRESNTNDVMWFRQTVRTLQAWKMLWGEHLLQMVRTQLRPFLWRLLEKLDRGPFLSQLLREADQWVTLQTQRHAPNSTPQEVLDATRLVNMPIMRESEEAVITADSQVINTPQDLVNIIDLCDMLNRGKGPLMAFDLLNTLDRVATSYSARLAVMDEHTHKPIDAGVLMVGHVNLDQAGQPIITNSTNQQPHPQETIEAVAEQETPYATLQKRLEDQEKYISEIKRDVAMHGALVQRQIDNAVPLEYQHAQPRAGANTSRVAFADATQTQTMPRSPTPPTRQQDARRVMNNARRDGKGVNGNMTRKPQSQQYRYEDKPRTIYAEIDLEGKTKLSAAGIPDEQAYESKGDNLCPLCLTTDRRMPHRLSRCVSIYLHHTESGLQGRRVTQSAIRMVSETPNATVEELLVACNTIAEEMQYDHEAVACVADHVLEAGYITNTAAPASLFAAAADALGGAWHQTHLTTDE